MVHHVVEKDVAVVDPALDAILGIKLPRFGQFVQVIAEGRHREKSQDERVQVRFRRFIAKPFFAQVPERCCQAEVLDLLPMGHHSRITVGKETVKEVVHRGITSLDEGADSNTAERLFFRRVPIEFPRPFEEVLPAPGSFGPYFRRRAAARAEEEGFQPFHSRAQARRDMGVGHEVRQLVGVKLLGIEQRVFQHVLAHVGLGKGRIDQVPSVWVFVFQAQLGPEGIAVRQAENGDVVRDQRVYRVFKVPFPVIPEDQAVIFAKKAV